MSILQELVEEQGYFKAGLLGLAGSGKTFTAVEMALFVRKYFGLDGPIGFFDTETGSAYVRPRWLRDRRMSRRSLARRPFQSPADPSALPDLPHRGHPGQSTRPTARNRADRCRAYMRTRAPDPLTHTAHDIRSLTVRPKQPSLCNQVSSTDQRSPPAVKAR